MKKGVVVAACAVWIITGASLIWAQGEFPMKYTQFSTSDQNMQYRCMKHVMKAEHSPSRMKALPRDFSGRATYFLAPLNGRQVLMVMDSSTPPNLYVDTNGNDDLSDEKPFTATTDGQRTQFGPISFSSPGVKEEVPLSIRVETFLRDAVPQYLTLMPDGFYSSTVQLGGESYSLALLDANFDGRYNSPLALPIPANSLTGSLSDIIALDTNKDGNFDCVQRMEIYPLAKMVAVNDVYYSLKIAPTGATVNLEKVAPPMSSLDVKCPGAELSLWSDICPTQTSGSEGKWKLPAGRYMTNSIRLVKKDSQGAEWVLTGTAREGKLRDIDLRQKKSAVLKMGPPLVMKVQAYKFFGNSSGAPGGQNGSQVSVNMSLVGQAAEQYSARITKDGHNLPPPKFKILSAAGKIMESGDFEYG